MLPVHLEGTLKFTCEEASVEFKVFIKESCFGNGWGTLPPITRRLQHPLLKPYI